MKPRVIVVSNRLPISIDVHKKPIAVSRSMGGLATSLSAIGKRYPMVWIGWAGNTRHLFKRQLAKLAIPSSLVPINIPQRLFHRYYNRLSNGVFWPVLHGMEPPIKPKLTDWYAMHRVADRFALAVIEQLRPNDVIWVHDFHLIFLIEALRKQHVENRIGFFLHTPVPTYKHFKVMNKHRQLLQSLMQADLIGVQTEHDAQNFMAIVKAAGLILPARSHVGVFPIGINWEQYTHAHHHVSVQRQLARVQKIAGKRYVVLSISRLDYTKGIIEQLRAFEMVATKYKLTNIIYRLVVAPSRETRLEYRRLEQNIAATVTEINERFAREDIDAYVSFEYRSHSFEEVNAWYRVTDLLLITPRADGMNLVVKEYVAARQKPGAIVLSRTAGVAVQLRDAVLVNPTSIASISAGIRQAIYMGPDERQQRWKALRANVRQQDIFLWTTSFIKALESTKS